MADAGPVSWTPAELESDDLKVHVLEELRPVPPSAPSTTDLPVEAETARPVYDPYSARRRRTPEWLVNYIAMLAVSDAVAATAQSPRSPWRCPCRARDEPARPPWLS